MRRARMLLAGAVAVLLLSGCVGSSRSLQDYRLKAANTAQALAGVVGVSEALVRQAEADRVPAAFTSQALSEQQSDATSIVSGFLTVQPPGEASDAIRTSVQAVGREVEDALSGLVSDARRGRLGRSAAAAVPLQDLRARLERLQQLSEPSP